MPVKITDKITIGGGDLVIIAGPCMAENLEICMETGRFLKSLCEELGLGYIFKSSYDKANRSSESTVRGPGRMVGCGECSRCAANSGLSVPSDGSLACGRRNG